ncbi:hypothetical protein, partial [Pseudomonas putida]
TAPAIRAGGLPFPSATPKGPAGSRVGNASSRPWRLTGPKIKSKIKIKIKIKSQSQSTAKRSRVRGAVGAVFYWALTVKDKSCAHMSQGRQLRIY